MQTSDLECVSTLIYVLKQLSDAPATREGICAAGAQRWEMGHWSNAT